MELWLVADTNLFFECRALVHLPWGELGHDPVVVLLTKPVLDEIDKHKKGAGRTRERALEIFGLVRSMLTANEEEREIRSASPRVLMRLSGARPNPRLKDDLDYSKTDEKLVGIVSSLQSDGSEKLIKLFTDDTGPASTASGLGLPFQMIDGSWRRALSESTEAKKIKELEMDLATYRAQEPHISIEPCKELNSSNVVEVVRRIASPLTESEIGEIIASLCAKHPRKDDFTPPAASTRTMADGEIVRTEYLSPPNETVAEYCDRQYPRWIEKCRSILATLHLGRDVEAPPLIVSWPMLNIGTRPASQVRVVFEAKGPLKLRRLPDENLDEKAEEELSTSNEAESSHSSSIPSFPTPPRAPKFLENVTRTPPPPRHNPTSMSIPPSVMSVIGTDIRRQGFDMLRPINEIEKATFITAAQRHAPLLDPSFANAFGTAVDPRPFPIPSLRRRHNPEAFYYSDWLPRDAVKRGALTCELWRHKADEELFEFEVLFDKDGSARGTVECTVHAENLTQPEQMRTIVARGVEHFSVRDIALAMVKACR